MKKKTRIICSTFFAAMSIVLYFVSKISEAEKIFYSISNTVVFPAIGLMQKLGWKWFMAIGIALCTALCIYFAIFYQTE